MPAWPTKSDSQIDEKAWKGRELRELNFEDESRSLKLGQYKALDFYGDGSLYFLDCPGHATGHICGLARTSANPPEFTLMGSDVAHHGGELRPTDYIPLPKEIIPSPLVAPFAKTSMVCPGAIFEAIHPKKSSREPFVRACGPGHENQDLAAEQVQKMFEFDAQANVFVVIAHDKSLLDVVDFYPKSANEWKRKGWKEQGRWRFLRDYNTGLPEYTPA